MNNKLLLALAAVFLMQLVTGALAWRGGGLYALDKFSHAITADEQLKHCFAERFGAENGWIERWIAP